MSVATFKMTLRFLMKSQVPHWGQTIKIYAKCKMSPKKNLLFFQAPAKMKLTSDNSA